MRIFFFFLLLLPALVALGHDAYLYSKNMDKGFGFTDVGFLWDTYHKESHDKWKESVRSFEHTIEDLDPIESGFMDMAKDKDEAPRPKAAYEEGIQFTDDAQNTSMEAELVEREPGPPQMTELQTYIALLLEQKAVFVAGAFGGFFILLTLILGAIFGNKSSGKMDKVSSLKKDKRKGGGYKYGRK